MPALAHKAMGDAVARISSLAGKSVGVARKATPRARAAARR
jgi:hypothetical protein